MRPFGRFVMIALGCVFVVLLAVHTGANVIEGRSLERVLSDLRTKGEPLTLSEIAPPRVPDDRNAAILYQRAFQLLQRPVGDPSGEILTGFISVDPALRRKATSAKVRQILERDRPALDLIRRAASMPECRFPVNYEAGAGAKFPHLGHLREAARLLAASSLIEAMDGRSPDSLADIGTMVDMAHQISREPTIISQLVEYACLSIAESTLHRSMELDPPDPDPAAEIDRKLAAYDVYGPFTRAMEGERCFGLWAFNTVEHDPNGAAMLMNLSGSSESPNRGSAGLANGLVALAGPLLKKDELFYLDAMQDTIDQIRTRMPSPRVHLMRTSEEAIPRYAIISRLTLPVFDKSIQRRDDAAARLGLAEWSLALNEVRRRKGRYPSSLADAVRMTGWPLPSDPFTNEPFHYLAQPGGYLLYSVGPNARDDGGRNGDTEPRKPRPRELAFQSSRDDIIWRVGSPHPPTPSPERRGGA